MKTFSSIRDLESLVGREIGVSDEIVLDQAMIDGFAEVTGDEHWTYVDTERCAHEASHGQTMAHPALLLGLITQLVGKIVAFTANMPTTFSYGFNGIRFPAPARAGQRVRLRLGVARIERFRGGLQSYWTVVLESPGAAELCLSGEWVTRTYLHIGFFRRVKLILRRLGVLSAGGHRELSTQTKGRHTAAPSQAPQRTMRSFEDVADFLGKQIGVSDWIVIDQEKIDAFAKVTGDYYWTHSDPERCKRESPYGRTIAHGALMLGLIPMLVRQIVDWDGNIAMVTCAFDKIRYPAPALSGSRFQVLLGLSRMERLESDARICWTVLFQAEGAEKPCLAAEWITQARFQAGRQVHSAS